MAIFARVVSALAAAMLVSVLSSAPGRAHEGHDHGPEPAAAPGQAHPRGAAQSGDFELVAVAEGAQLAFYLDRFATNEPVTGASLEVETPEGPAKADEHDGVYRLAAPWLVKGGHIDLIVTVALGSETEILPLSLDIPGPAAATASAAPRLAALIRGLLQPASLLAGGIGLVLGIVLMALSGRRRAVSTLVLGATLVLLAPASNVAAHEGHDHGAEAAATPAGGDRAMRQPDGAVFVPKPIQRIFGLRTMIAKSGTHPRSVELPGRIIPDPNSSGFVQTAVGGTLAPPPNGFPRLGAAVRKGDVLATVTPALQTIDISDMRQRQGELDQQISIVVRRLARFETLAPSGAVARSQLEETKLELEGLRDRRAALDRVRAEPIDMTAPVSGVIAEGTPVAGQIAQTNSVIFHIVDPDKLWIEALSFGALASPGQASARTAGGKSLALAFRGSGLADRSQSIPVHFAIEGDTAGLRAGQFVTVFTDNGEPRQGLALPRSAVVRAANGQEFVFEHTAAERFEPRPVRIEPLDAERVLIAAGLEEGRRIVVQGAELLDQVR